MACRNRSVSMCTCNPSCYKHPRSLALSNSSVTDLPISLITEILVKLPIKSVICCKCVCMSWHNLIMDPHFATLYLKNPPSTVIAISCNSLSDTGIEDISFDFLEIENNDDASPIPFNPKALSFGDRGISEIEGSCNGLLCLVQRPQFEVRDMSEILSDRTSYKLYVYVINPLLGEYLMLPTVELVRNVTFEAHGIGFSTLSGCFKVLKVVRTYPGGILGPEYKVHGEIFTIGADDEWRSLEESSINFPVFSRGVNLNGVLYMFGDVGTTDAISVSLLAFDIEEERGRRIQPPLCSVYELMRISLAVWNDRVCFVDNNSESQLDIWSLETNGVADLWSKQIILRSWIPSDLHSSWFIPIAALRNGDLLLSPETDDDMQYHLILFNPETKMCSVREVCNGASTIFSFCSYAPNFFALKNCFPQDSQDVNLADV